MFVVSRTVQESPDHPPNSQVLGFRAHSIRLAFRQQQVLNSVDKNQPDPRQTRIGKSFIASNHSANRSPFVANRNTIRRA